MLDNVGDMILMAGLLVGFGFPRDFVIGKIALEVPAIMAALSAGPSRRIGFG